VDRSRVLAAIRQGCVDPFVCSRYYGKDSPSPPPAPDYTGAAQATAAGNLEATRAAAAANRVNQVTPYGNLTYTQQNNQTFDQAGYDAALAKYQSDLAAYNAQSEGLPGAVHVSPIKNAPVAPNRSSYLIDNPDIGWTATTTLSPEQQAIYNSNTALTQGLLGTAQKGLSSVDRLLSDPTIDESRLPQSMINPGESYIDASQRLMQPQFDRQRSMFGTQMANQGIPTSSEAYMAGDQALSDNQNRAMLQAIQTGMGQNTAARQAGIQEQTYLQDRPLNIVNALRTGNQTQLPQFTNVPQQATTQGADLLGAMQGQTQYNQGLYNSQAAQAAQDTQGMYGLGSAALTALAMF